MSRLILCLVFTTGLKVSSLKVSSHALGGSGRTSAPRPDPFQVGSFVLSGSRTAVFRSCFRVSTAPQLTRLSLFPQGWPNIRKRSIRRCFFQSRPTSPYIPTCDETEQCFRVFLGGPPSTLLLETSWVWSVRGSQRFQAYDDAPMMLHKRGPLIPSTCCWAPFQPAHG